MQFLKVDSDMGMADLRKIVGAKNADNVLTLNQLSVVPRINKAMDNMYYTIVNNAPEVTNERKMSLLSSVSTDKDVFEAVALLDEDGWKYFSATNSLPNMLRMPDTVQLPNSQETFGNTGEAISLSVYQKAMEYLYNNEPIDPIIFNTYDTSVGMRSNDTVAYNGSLQWFNIPWGQITLYSSLTDESVDFPVYPEEYEDGYTANYETMPDMLYQYEPWYTYKSSGPRTINLTFKMHRDMWTGDHRDGKCNSLIRFCQANCFPAYNGASVNTPIVALYIAGKPYIRGILTEEKHTYSGPLGLDKFPLAVDLTLTFTEISVTPLNFETVRKKGLIE